MTYQIYLPFLISKHSQSENEKKNLPKHENQSSHLLVKNNTPRNALHDRKKTYKTFLDNLILECNNPAIKTITLDLTNSSSKVKYIQASTFQEKDNLDSFITTTLKSVDKLIIKLDDDVPVIALQIVDNLSEIIKEQNPITIEILCKHLNQGHSCEAHCKLKSEELLKKCKQLSKHITIKASSGGFVPVVTAV